MAAAELVGWDKNGQLVLIGIDGALAAATGHEDGLGATACHHPRERAGGAAVGSSNFKTAAAVNHGGPARRYKCNYKHAQAM